MCTLPLADGMGSCPDLQLLVLVVYQAPRSLVSAGRQLLAQGAREGREQPLDYQAQVLRDINAIIIRNNMFAVWLTRYRFRFYFH